MRYLTSVAVAVAVAVGLAGCDAGPRFAPVGGTVTLDGKPLAHKAVRFEPLPGSPGMGAGGITDAAGRYTVLAVYPGSLADQPGVQPGRYRVAVTEPQFPVTGPPATAPVDGSPAPAVGSAEEVGVRGRSAIPARYRTIDTSGLEVEVPPEGGVFDFALTSRR